MRADAALIPVEPKHWCIYIMYVNMYSCAHVCTSVKHVRVADNLHKAHEELAVCEDWLLAPDQLSLWQKECVEFYRAARPQKDKREPWLD